MHAQVKQLHPPILRIPGSIALEVWTPQMAEEQLRRNASNRKLRHHNVEQFCSAMSNGEWMINGETIKIDQQGNLIDGQHRLSAIMLLGKPIELLVHRGLSKEAFKTIDTGMRRSKPDTLYLLGYKDVNQLSAAFSIVHAHKRGKLGKSVFSGGQRSGSWTSNAELANRIGDYKGLEDSVRYAVAQNMNRLGMGSLAAALHFIAKRKNKEKIEAFIEKLGTGAGLRATSPIYHLRERMILQKNRQTKFSRATIAAFMIKAWNAYVEGKPMQVLAWNETKGERFPTITL